MQRLFLWLRRVEGAVLAGAILAMAAATIVNVVARNVTGTSLPATEELNRFLIVLVCFVGLGYAAGEGRHIRMSALSDVLPLAARRWLLAFVCGTTALLLVALAWWALGYALSVDRRSPVLGVPLGRLYLLAPLGLVLGAVQYALAAWRNVVGPEAWIAWDRRDGYEELADDRGPRDGGL